MKSKTFLFAFTVLEALAIVALIVLLSRRGEETDIRLDPTEMVFVEGGTFIMGSDDPDTFPTERPAHKVTLHDFHIGKYEVTMVDFAAFVKETGYTTLAENDTLPVTLLDGRLSSSYYGLGSYIVKENNVNTIRTCVNWRYDQYGNVVPDSCYATHPVVHLALCDAEAYCNWLACKTGHPYRLPTEAEWEYAARGGKLGKGTIYSGSDEIDEVAWYRYNSDALIHPVGTKKPNELGIYDMSGNVGEWVGDTFSDYTAEPKTDPYFRRREFMQYGIARGGSWYRNPSYCRPENRMKIYTISRGGGVGFRLAY